MYLLQPFFLGDIDSDGDGQVDAADEDDDNDGLLDVEDDDDDGDGVQDEDEDNDGDGLTNDGIVFNFVFYLFFSNLMQSHDSSKFFQTNGH